MQKSKVLVVDDEIRVLEAVERILSERFIVRLARTPAEAEGICEGEVVHVILCDQRMPELTGVAFLRKVRERWPEIVRIILSGYTDPADIIEGINEAGIYQYIMKPWHPDHLLLTVENAA
ncbi:MAG: response regulator, partial [Gammaproteobacteria bacterium]|nr:response regulator [Gammaproteobacteria bacterium]